jgi:hypothetical protein
MDVCHSNTPYKGASPFHPAYKHYRQAVEESRKLTNSLDIDSSPLLPREIVEEERKAMNLSIEQLKRDIETKDDQLRKAQTSIRELQESGSPLRLSRTHSLKQPQKHSCAVTSGPRSNAPKL